VGRKKRQGRERKGEKGEEGPTSKARGKIRGGTKGEWS